MPSCGLDFGTSNSAVALPDGSVLPIDRSAEDPRLFRSVLFFPEGERSVLAGAEAIARYLDDGEGRFLQSVKSWLPSASFTSTSIRGRSFRLEELVATLLRRLREEAERAAGQPLVDVVLGRPAVLSPDPALDALAEERLGRAAGLAGFSRVRFVIEPIAAALAYEAQLAKDELVLVADFGAGTSDFTLMRLGPGRRGREDRRADVVASSGVRIGGDHFDGAILRKKLLRRFGAGSTYSVFASQQRLPVPPHLLHKLLAWHEMSFIRDRSTLDLIDRMEKTSDAPEAIAALRDLVVHNLGYHLFRAIEDAKVRLSGADEARIRFHEGAIAIDERLTRAELERASAPLLDGLAACADALLARAGDTERIDAVFLTGGTSQIPAVRALFAARFGEDRLRTADSFTSVASGLGRAAGAR